MSEFKSKIKCDELDYFCKVILALETEEECYRFFEDISTINEIKSMAQRLQVAKMLREKRTYKEIGEITGASTATISRVNRALMYGNNGYKNILNKIENEAEK